MNNSSEDAGANYLALHELAHLTPLQLANNQQNWADGIYTAAERLAHERQANDIARAFATYGQLGAFPTTPGDGYSTPGALPVTTP